MAAAGERNFRAAPTPKPPTGCHRGVSSRSTRRGCAEPVAARAFAARRCRSRCRGRERPRLAATGSRARLSCRIRHRPGVRHGPGPACSALTKTAPPGSRPATAEIPNTASRPATRCLAKPPGRAERGEIKGGRRGRGLYCRCSKSSFGTSSAALILSVLPIMNPMMSAALLGIIPLPSFRASEAQTRNPS